MRSAIATRGVRAGAVVALLAALTWAGTQPAAAHESREVDRFTFVVGFAAEPAYTYIPNAVSLSITETESEEPFEDLGDSLQVDVTFGEETFTSTLRPQFGEPGSYRADFVPSRPGQWTFRFYGTVDGVEVDETFISGPETFNDVHSLSEESFPAQDPSIGELAERLEQELARVNERLDALDGGSTEDTSGEAAENSSDALARGLSAGALLVGVGALAAALLVGRRRS
ncbi:MAG TPA: hypothetical protein VFR23_03510 [Jiangellaceae bacterium]|nr:hypothetical protein [Jiangellaceae bacterium]